MRIFVRVSLEVHLEVAFSREATAAHVALVGPFAGVRPDVNLERGVAAENLAAVATAMLEQRRVTTTVGRCFVVGERELVEKAVRQNALRGRVEHLLRLLLQHRQRVCRLADLNARIVIGDDVRE